MRVLFTLLVLLCAWSVPTHATPQQDVQKAENYLNNLTTARARFTQIAPDGSRRTGLFYLNRPGKLRFEYDPPTKDFVVADGTFIYFYDSELQEQSHAPIGQTLADFILRDNLDLNGEINVTDVKRAAGLLQLTLTQSADPDAGNLKLGFSENPFMLKKWRVTDAQGAITEVMLADVQTNVTLSKKLFSYRDPSRDVQRFNR